MNTSLEEETQKTIQSGMPPIERMDSGLVYLEQIKLFSKIINIYLILLY